MQNGEQTPGGGPSAPDPGPNSSWEFKPDEQSQTSPSLASNESVNWTASEFVAHHKGAMWFIGLAFIAAALAVGIFLLTKDEVSTGVVVIAAIAFGALAARQPRELKYMLDNSGVRIGEKFYPYELFKSFSVLEEGAISSIWLMPLKRFMLGLTIYYPPDEEEKIMNVLAAHLPFEDRKIDPVDNLMRKIRF